MNLKKLTALLFAGVTAATPLVTSAQNPTILQGNYISNVFGQANFVLNPNAQTNVANVTLTNATATRSTTTPLVATSEWNVTVTSANGTAAWATRSFDEGMKNQNCEARFSYRGFQATSKAQIKQGANVVAELTLTPSATDPRIASINFPCGDLSSATTFVISDSATLSGTNEIGGIYVGLATNMANVAQAELVVSAYRSGTQSVPNAFATPHVFNNELKDLYNEFDTSNGRFSPKRAGDYLVTSAVLWNNYAWAAGKYYEITLRVNGTARCRVYKEVQAAVTMYLENQITCVISMVPGQYLETYVEHDFGSTIDTNPGGPNSYNYTYITRLPSSSELVVTPETQNVWGGARYFGTNLFENKFSGSTADPNTYVAFGTGSGALNWSTARTLFGKGLAPSTNSQLLGVKLADLPVGSYMVTIRGDFKPSYPTSSAGWYSVCGFDIYENNTATSISRNNGIMDSTPGSPLVFSGKHTTLRGVYNNTSVGDREFVLRASKTQDSTSGSLATCAAASSTSNSGTPSEVSIDVTPLDNASNSALYVQGPVKAAATGAAIPTGYVGEEQIGYVTYQTFLATTTANSEIDLTGASITLTPGVWDVEYSASAFVYRNPASTASVICRVRIRDSANNIESLTSSNFGISDSVSSVLWAYHEASKSKRVYVTTTKTYKLSLTSTQSSATGLCQAGTGDTTGGMSGDESTTYIRAIRIN